MEVKLRDYQEQLINGLRSEMRQHRRVLGVLPTGGGKTYCGSFMLKSFSERFPEKKAIVKVHREELLWQWYNSLRAVGLNPGLCMAGRKHINQPITIAMVETFNKLLGKNPTLNDKFYFGIADEAHIGNHRKVIDKMNYRLLGLTATPVSSNRSMPMNEVYGAIVAPFSEKDLIERGHLLSARTFSIEHDWSNLRKKGKDFSEESQLAEFIKPKLYDGACKEYLDHCQGSKSSKQFHRAICFNVNIEHSLEQVNVFRANGIACEHVDGKTPKERRKELFAMLKSGEIDVLHNVGVATIGLDETCLEAIILNRATSSLALYIQMCGRGARPHEFNPFSKLDHFKIIDMGANYTRHGLFGSPIDWNGIFTNQNNDSKAKPKHKPKECPECAAIIPPSVSACPWCDHEFTVAEIQEAELEGLNAKEIREYKFQNLPPHLRKPKKDLSDSELHDFGKAMGYKPAWAWKQIKLREQWAVRRFKR